MPKMLLQSNDPDSIQIHSEDAHTKVELENLKIVFGDFPIKLDNTPAIIGKLEALNLVSKHSNNIFKYISDSVQFYDGVTLSIVPKEDESLAKKIQDVVSYIESKKYLVDNEDDYQTGHFSIVIENIYQIITGRRLTNDDKGTD